jgi:hypothetical protein
MSRGPQGKPGRDVARAAQSRTDAVRVFARQVRARSAEHAAVPPGAGAGALPLSAGALAEGQPPSPLSAELKVGGGNLHPRAHLKARCAACATKVPRDLSTRVRAGQEPRRPNSLKFLRIAESTPSWDSPIRSPGRSLGRCALGPIRPEENPNSAGRRCTNSGALVTGRNIPTFGGADGRQRGSLLPG